MSLQTWIEEFYPVDAQAVANTNDVMAMVEHSIKKWEGLRLENLMKHKVILASDGVYDSYDNIFTTGPGFRFSGESCALCRQFCNYGNPKTFDIRCSRCPLQQTLHERCDVGRSSPWLQWVMQGNPEPMIASLTNAKQLILEGKYNG